MLSKDHRRSEHKERYILYTAELCSKAFQLRFKRFCISIGWAVYEVVLDFFFLVLDGIPCSLYFTQRTSWYLLIPLMQFNLSSNLVDSLLARLSPRSILLNMGVSISKYAATWRCNIPCSPLRDLILFPNNIFPFLWVCIVYLRQTYRPIGCFRSEHRQTVRFSVGL